HSSLISASREMSGYPQWSDGGGHHHQQQQNHPQHPKQTSWLLPDYAGSIHSGSIRPPPLPPPPQYFHAAGGGGYAAPAAGMGGYGYGGGFPIARKPLRAASEVSFDTSAKDPESVRARVFIGSLNASQVPVTREDVIELCLPFGAVRGVTFFKKQGYAFVQFEEAPVAEAACRELNGVRWKGCLMDVHPVDAPSTRGGVGGGGVPPTADKQQWAQQSAKTPMEPTTNYDEISYDTSSRDPVLLRARVFIGSLSRNPIVRNDIIELCQPFGKVTAVTLFKQGYAFIQFESPVDAVDACDKLNGLTWKGNKIDVHLAMEGSTRKRNTEDVESPPPTAMDWSGSAPKRAREEEAPKAALEMICKTCHFSCGDVAEFVQHREGGQCQTLTRTGEPPTLGCAQCEAVLPNSWRLLFHLMDSHHHALKLVSLDGSQAGLDKAKSMDAKGREEWWKSVEKWLDGQQKEGEEGEVEEEGDEMIVKLTEVTMVCGSCKLVTECWQKYRDHKKKDCIKPRDQLEPSCLVCAMCGELFVSAWKALFHLMEFHRMKLFYPDYTKEAQTRSNEQFARERAVVEKRMKNWIESQGI
ncbi:hypothetical protein PENTCL1PPCAC_13060, partial [Pristionchus entomophagus]